MENHTVVSPEAWLAARKAFLVKEKEFTRSRDQLSQARRELPWEKVEKASGFDGPNGKETLAQLFAGKSQLIVYHFMFGPSWDEGCHSCSFWADNFNGIVTHLRQRDVTMVAISRAPLAKLETFKKRMGWSFKWLSSLDSDFNYDYHVSTSPAEKAKGEGYYNYAQTDASGDEMPGISVFYKDDKGNVFHTYSCYARGLDMLNTAYHYLDLTPKGRDEDKLGWPMAWLKLHDQYDH
jgi:predicted dithiol-disulfide oxidoreductase (DUF899 family)